MPVKLQKTLQNCLSKIKNPNPSSKKWMLSVCKHPKTPSFAFERSHSHRNDDHDDHPEDQAATLSDIDRFLVENFKSLYIKNDGDDHDHEDQTRRKKKIGESNYYNKENKKEEEYHHFQVTSPGEIVYDDSPRFDEPPLHLSGSNRFFFAPGSSSSLIEEARLSLTTSPTATAPTTSDEEGSRSRSRSSSTRSSGDNTDTKNVNATVPDDYIAVKTYSRSPSVDFRRSMQAMIEARLQENGKVDWDFMQEILFCFLNLNEKKSHKFILSAFVDLVVGLRQNSDKATAPARPRRRNSSRSGRRKMREVT
ncbi:transcription repressor OFP14 [Mercurialis annua]|uniref:transcription repressor OFP14-like n=1 Tax=Mercurialis annua TaxID=3986 RepID=UPI002160B279|nr:transcription repressor OFP14-like [Mercurialis annua]XP_050232928.1 transcription repressor OFP14 [Mercurialis annua]